MAFIGKFVPFSELVKFSGTLTEAPFENVRKFEDENALGYSQIFPTELKSVRGRDASDLPRFANAALGDDSMLTNKIVYSPAPAQNEFATLIGQKA